MIDGPDHDLSSFVAGAGSHERCLAEHSTDWASSRGEKVLFSSCGQLLQHMVAEAQMREHLLKAVSFILFLVLAEKSPAPLHLAVCFGGVSAGDGNQRHEEPRAAWESAGGQHLISDLFRSAGHAKLMLLEPPLLQIAACGVLRNSSATSDACQSHLATRTSLSLPTGMTPQFV